MSLNVKQMKLLSLSTLLTATLLLNGCIALQAISSATSVGSLYYAKKGYELSVEECDIIKPIYLDGDVTGLTDNDLKQIVNHNEIYEQLCQ